MDYQERKKKAYALRKAGFSYSDISLKTDIPKSTLSNWFSGLPYKPNKYTINKIGKARIASAKKKKEIKNSSIARAKKIARKDIGVISRRDLFMVGLGVYMGEGTKTSNVIRIVNANPQIIRLGVRWFKEVIGLKNENLSMRMYLYPDSNERECLKFWMGVTGLPKKNFLSTQIDTRGDKKSTKKSKLQFGTVHLGVKSNGDKDFGVFLFRRIEAWQNEVLC